MWNAEDFLSTGDILDSMSYDVNINRLSGGLSLGYFVIQTTNSNFYISANQGAGQRTLATESATWNVFNPLNAGVASIGASVGTLDMSASNINAVGYYLDSSSAATTMRHYVSYFQATSVPEPSTQAMLIMGVGALCFARRRKLRA